MRSPSLRTGGLKTKVWPTMSVSPVRWASRTSSSASAVELVIGFSTKTCLPASSAALASAKCVEMGVATTTASTARSASTSS